MSYCGIIIPGIGGISRQRQMPWQTILTLDKLDTWRSTDIFASKTLFSGVQLSRESNLLVYLKKKKTTESSAESAYSNNNTK